MKKKTFLLLLAIISIIPLLSLFSHASDQLSDYENGITSDLCDLLPRDVANALPQDMLRGDVTYDTSFFFRVITEVLQSCSKEVLSDFASLLGLILIASVLTVMRTAFFSDKVGKAFSFLTLVCTALSVYQILESLWVKCSDCLDRIVSFGNGLIPIITSLLTAGGNTTAAAVSANGLTSSLSVVGNLTATLLYPMLRIGFAFSLMACVSGEISLDGLSSLVRRMCTTVLAVAMTAFSAILAFQTKLASSTDSVGARVLRFAIGTVVPMVGSAVNEAVHAVAGSLGYLRTFVGAISIFAIVLILLPVLINLFLYKLAFSFSAVISGILGCQNESKLLGEVRDLINFAIALLFFSSSVLLVFLTVFMKITSALSAA